jgi:WD40 repeat protein
MSDSTERLCIREERGAVGTCAISSDGTCIAYVSGLQVKIVRPPNKTPVAILVIPDFATALSFTPDGSKVVVGLMNDSIEIIPVNEIVSLPRLRNSYGFIEAVAFCPKGGVLATGHMTGEVHLWATSTGLAFDEGFELQGNVKALAWSADGRWIIAGGSSPAFYTFGIRNRYDDWVESFPSMRHASVYAEDNSQIVCWDCDTSSIVADIRLELTSVRGLAFSATQRRLAAGCDDGRVRTFRIWERAGNWRTDRDVILEFNGSILWSLVFSPDGTLLAGGTGYYSESDSAHVFLWDVGGDPLTKQMQSAVDSNDVRDDSNFGLLLHRFEGHRKAVTQLAFTEDGGKLASGSPFESVRVWDLAQGTCTTGSTGPTDPAAVLAGSDRMPLYLISGPLGAVIHSAKTGNDVGWLHHAGSYDLLFLADPSGRIWAAADGNYLGLYAIEGPGEGIKEACGQEK